MTRFEYIKTLDQKQMAHYLCFQFTECSSCPVERRCGAGDGKQNGWLSFLEKNVTPYEAIQIKPIY